MEKAGGNTKKEARHKAARLMLERLIREGTDQVLLLL
jgi:hypothetical protein